MPATATTVRSGATAATARATPVGALPCAMGRVLGVRRCRVTPTRVLQLSVRENQQRDDRPHIPVGPGEAAHDLLRAQLGQTALTAAHFVVQLVQSLRRACGSPATGAKRSLCGTRRSSPTASSGGSKKRADGGWKPIS